MFAVVITEKGGAQRRLDFDKNEVTIGRVQGNDIILPKGNVSKRHSRIVLKDNRFIVVDLKSTNGTYVNGRKITSPLVVKSGDKIYIGDFILTLEEGAGAGGFDAAQASPVPSAPPSMPGPPPMSGPPMPGPPPMSGPPMSGPPMPGPPPMPPMPGPPPAAPPPVASPQRPSAPPPLPPRPAPAPTPAHMAPPMPSPAPMPAAAPPMPAPAPPMPAPAPPPMPTHSAPPIPHHAPPPPMPMAGGAAERFPLDEEPAGHDDHAPSPRIVANAPAPMPPAPAPMPMAPPAPMPPAPMAAPMPSAPMASAPMHSAPVASPMVSRAPSKGGQAALSAVVSHAARSFNPYEVPAPAGEGDPRRDGARRAVEAAVDAVSKSGPSFDREAIGHAALEELVGLGALGDLIADGGVNEIVVQGPDTIVADRGQGLAPEGACFSSSEALSVIVGRLVTLSGGYFDRGKAMHEGTLPMGVHFTAVLPPIAVGGPIVELRRTQRPGLTGEQLVSRGMLSNEMLDVLRRASRGRKNVVVVGSSDAGVVQLVSAVANLAQNGEHVLAIEDVPRLELGSATVVRLTAASGTSLEDVITQGGRMRADRVVIDGVRGKETLAALLTAASRSGSIVGVHSAPSAEAYDHLGALARLGGATSEAITSVLPSAVHVVVRMGRGNDGRARVESLAEVRRGGNGAQVVELFGSNFSSTGQSPSF